VTGDSALDIIFEDSALVVLNKPSGLLSVPGKGIDKQDCLSARVQVLYPEALTVHRLDMATSGLLVMARSVGVQRQLSLAFERRAVEKRYVAIVVGEVEAASPLLDWKLIDLRIGQDWLNRPRQKVDADHGKPSQTRYRVIGYDRATDTTRLVLAPITGRTHQLRVHLQAIGHEIVGDQLYAPPEVQAKADRLLLHASRLSLTHPVSGEPITWECPPPF
jgi:tRNA pseudouridine32 synthase / 23S rRNA pseudouridine746 synthase